MMKNRLLFTLMIALILTSVSSVYGQEADDSAARAVVQAALDYQEGGYRFNSTQTTVQRYLQGDAVIVEYFSEQHIEGQVADNEDYDVHIKIRNGTNTETAGDLPALVSELLSYRGVQYINMQTDGTIYETAFPDVAAGWHNREELLSALGDSVQKAAVEYFTTFRRFKDIPYAETVLSVIEQLPETIDDVDLRVFEVNVDALAMLSLMYQTSTEEAQQLIEAQADAIATGESSLSYTFWIGAEDGFLYQAESIGHFRWPYQVEGRAEAGYDLEMIMKGEQHVWDQGEVAEIDLPEEIELPG